MLVEGTSDYGRSATELQRNGKDQVLDVDSWHDVPPSTLPHRREAPP
ncbi:hypothetical protein T05_9142, partial [Trichinella murrelli]